MATVPETTRTVNKAFRATLYDEPGALAKVEGTIIFFRDADGALIDYVPALAPRLVVLGECGIAETQALMDRLHGGYAAIACGRAN